MIQSQICSKKILSKSRKRKDIEANFPVNKKGSLWRSKTRRRGRNGKTKIKEKKTSSLIDRRQQYNIDYSILVYFLSLCPNSKLPTYSILYNIYLCIYGVYLSIYLFDGVVKKKKKNWSCKRCSRLTANCSNCCYRPLR